MLAELEQNRITVRVNGQNLKVRGPAYAVTKELLEAIRLNKAVLMAELKGSLSYWLDLIRQAASKEEIFAILDQFRPLTWTDEQRATISRWYHARLDSLARQTEHGQ